MQGKAAKQKRVHTLNDVQYKYSNDKQFRARKI